MSWHQQNINHALLCGNLCVHSKFFAKKEKIKLIHIQEAGRDKCSHIGHRSSVCDMGIFSCEPKCMN